MSSRTFIQPGAVQRYRKPIALPSDTVLIHIWAAFDYRMDLHAPTRFLIRLFARPPKDLDWRRGIDNHTIRRTFYVSMETARDDHALELVPPIETP